MAIDCIIQPHYSFVTMNLAVKACVFLLLENYTSMLNIMPITKFFEIPLENFPKCRSRRYLQLPCQRMVIRYWPVVAVGSMLLKQRHWLPAKMGSCLSDKTTGIFFISSSQLLISAIDAQAPQSTRS